MNLLPAKKVVILKDVGKQETKSGIYLPEAPDRQKPEMGVVIAIGAGKLPLEIKEGDKIVYRKYADNKVEIDNEKFNFVEFKDILAVVKNGA